MKNMVVMEVEQILKINRNLKMYIKEEQLITNDIIKYNNNITNYYRTNNTQKISNLNQELSINFKKINTIHNNNTIVYNKNVQSYKDSAKKTIEIIEELGGK